MPKTEEKYIVALDIGTSKVCVLVGEVNDRGQIEIIGKGTSPMKGTRRGNIINLDQAIDAVKKAVDEAEVMAGLQIESVYVGVAGDHIRSVNSRGVVSVDGQAPGDLARRHRPRHRGVEVDQRPGGAGAAARDSARVRRRRPGRHSRSARDDRDAARSERAHRHRRADAQPERAHRVNKAGIAVQELVLEQLAAAEAVLTQDEREMGVLLMDIGAGTTDYAVFLEGNVVHTNVLPVGAGHFTSDISVVLRTPMEDAERIKKRYGCALGSLVTEDDPIEVPTVGGRAPKILSKHELTNILEPRAAEIAKLVYRDLEKVGLDKEIRSGVVVVGGGAEMDGMVEMVEQVFDQQARKGVPRGLGGLSDTVAGPEWAAAAGLLLWGFRNRTRKCASVRARGFAQVADSFKSAVSRRRRNSKYCLNASQKMVTLPGDGK